MQLLIVAGSYPDYSIRGIPYHISGEVPDWRDLVHRSRAELQNAGLRFMLDTRATAIGPDSRHVTVIDVDGVERRLSYVGSQDLRDRSVSGRG